MSSALHVYVSSALHAENSRLREDSLRLTAEVQRLTQRNSDLSQVRETTRVSVLLHGLFLLSSLQELECTGERLFALEREKEHLQPQLTRARQLQTEVITHCR